MRTALSDPVKSDFCGAITMKILMALTSYDGAPYRRWSLVCISAALTSIGLLLFAAHSPAQTTPPGDSSTTSSNVSKPEASADDKSIRPFRIDVPEEAIARSPTSCIRLRGVGPSKRIPNSSTTTSSTRGHFAAWEQPKLFTDEMRAAFKSVR
jgi:hypothetical protein